MWQQSMLKCGHEFKREYGREYEREGRTDSNILLSQKIREILFKDYFSKTLSNA